MLVDLKQPEPSARRARAEDTIPLYRLATPDEVARSVLYLASDQSSFTIGAMLMADGGMSV